MGAVDQSSSAVYGYEKTGQLSNSKTTVSKLPTASRRCMGSIETMLLSFRNRNAHHPRLRSSRVSIEDLLTSFAAEVTTSRPDQIDFVIENALSALLNLTGAGCVSWYEEDPDHEDLVLTLYSTDKPERNLLPSTLTPAELPYTLETLSNGKPVVYRTPEDSPTEACQDRDFLLKKSIWGLILAPSEGDTLRRGILAVAHLPKTTSVTDKFIGQLVTINDLIAASVERKRMWTLWHESEERFRWLFQNAPIGIAVENLAGRVLSVNPALCSMLGYSDQELLEIPNCDIWAHGSSDEDRIMLQRLREGIIRQYRTEKQLVRSNGARIWGRVDVALLSDGGGENPFVIRMVEDITERRVADSELLKTRTELQQLAEHLIQAQEEERHRISRELHDDIAQKLSLLSIGCDSLSQNLVDLGCDRELEDVSELKAQVDTLATDVHSLSHRLHSTRLQHLGLRSAIEELTKQISKQHQMSINLSTQGRDSVIPPDVALCLFRVTQEALTNAVRHSHAHVVFIELNIERGMARLQISDTGVGFDVSVCEGGIGLVSMRERLRMVGGELSVQSRRGEGTLITATVRFSEMIKDKAA